LLNVRSTCLFLGLSLAGLSAAAPMSAQTTAPDDQTAQVSTAAAPQDQGAAPAATPAPAAPTWSIGPIDFSGTIDGYYQWDAQHPNSHVNSLYNFDSPTNQFSLNLAKVALSHTADPVGFEFDLMYGNTAQTISNSTGTSDSFFDRNVEQAYVSFKPMKAKGFEIDFGKFVTSAGAEVIESYSNWNYSRSLLFAWAIPYFHFGVRTSWPMGKHLTGGFQVVNGWNNDFSQNARVTLGANVGVTYSKWSLIENYYGGKVNPFSETGYRHLFDTVWTVTPSSQFSVYVNYDWAQNRNPIGVFPNLARWEGIAAAVHYAPTSKWSFTPRFEVFDDAQGFEIGGGRQTVKEFTITGEYKLLEGLLWRAEYRRDWSNIKFFTTGTANGVGKPAKNEDTLTVAFIGYFGPKR
jgi:hypothetical protein